MVIDLSILKRSSETKSLRVMVIRITTFDTILRLLFGCCMIPMIQLGHPIFGIAVLELFFFPRPQPTHDGYVRLFLLT